MSARNSKTKPQRSGKTQSKRAAKKAEQIAKTDYQSAYSEGYNGWKKYRVPPDLAKELGNKVIAAHNARLDKEESLCHTIFFGKYCTLCERDPFCLSCHGHRLHVGALKLRIVKRDKSWRLLLEYGIAETAFVFDPAVSVVRCKFSVSEQSCDQNCDVMTVDEVFTGETLTRLNKFVDALLDRVVEE